jgi:hypothetical protein
MASYIRWSSYFGLAARTAFESETTRVAETSTSDAERGERARLLAEIDAAFERAVRSSHVSFELSP